MGGPTGRRLAHQTPSVLMSIPVLGPGDRVPTLTVPDLNGKTRLLYLEVFGGPILVAATPDPDSTESKAILSGMAKNAASFDRMGAHRFVLTRRPPPGKVDPGATVLIDPYGDGMKLFRPPLDDSGSESRSRASIAVLDPNQRVVAVFPAESQKDPVGKAISEAEGLREGTTREPQRLEQAAPALILDKLMPDELCDRLVAMWRPTARKARSATGSRTSRTTASSGTASTSYRSGHPTRGGTADRTSRGQRDPEGVQLPHTLALRNAHSPRL